MRRLIIALLVAVVATIPLTAHANPPSQALALCSGAPNGCSISIDPWLREGAVYSALITGNPNTRLTVVVYRAVIEAGVLAALEPISSGGEVITSSAGVARVTVTISPLSAGTPGGWALVSVAGLAGTDVTTTVGSFVPLGARVPQILGDDYATVKPAGAILDLTFVGAIPGSRYSVEYLDARQHWQDASREPAQADGPGETTIQYEIPRGLRSVDHQFRLRNLSDNAVSTAWVVRPGIDGQAQPRIAPFRPPPVGSGLTGTVPSGAHPAALVRAVALAVAATAIVVAIITVFWVARRRPRWAADPHA